jgi:hypothetical protein
VSQSLWLPMMTPTSGAEAADEVMPESYGAWKFL